MKRIVIEKNAQRALRHMPTNVSMLIVSKIERYAESPDSLAANIKRLQGRPGYRLRVGDWRVIFEQDATTITILDIGPRGGIYG